ncbi:MAG: hypothetical protein F2667_14710 [Actinobacteria bacterium]|uniref:Unannotated protein n=1 Tax=freshwater metagenome TaxID=449393 RepID=A0A6J6SIQ6_9ZZZZ|nr:hypothetical protein [Actinomycetota bacterium]
MTRTLLPRTAALLAAAPLLLLGACGTDDGGDDVAADPAPTSASPTSSPTAEPTVGTYPDFEPSSYSYTLDVSCFCAGLGPVRVVVEDDKVTSATYVERDRAAQIAPGDDAPKYRWITIDDIIDSANDTSAARVDVEWPDGQDYPTSVYVDQDEMMADEEMGYTISDVVVD